MTRDAPLSRGLEEQVGVQLADHLFKDQPVWFKLTNLDQNRRKFIEIRTELSIGPSVGAKTTYWFNFYQM